ncbi:serine/threonine-protein kinase [Nocardia arthritidis]|uniref:non-specific serine/threonine protein kinase n=1 Tax=Nocardia arthritidis TaxID=228602 RepID=A0A6G9YEH4_9NOCA|nr:serine/threonine-protein kinase [Nocardia arthritidis]QIS11631.1 protein kinase [Nocardia arthritidis]
MCHSHAAGEGGSSEVYLADDPVRGRPVALKILNRDAAVSAAARSRFRNEYAVAALLRHPNVITVFDHGQLDGRPWLTYEYVPGGTAVALVPDRHAEMDPVRVLPLLAGIAAGLDYVHGREVVHLDVKPANMLVGAHNSGVLTDFGIARRSADRRHDGRVMFGSIPYAAPEVLRGGPPGPAADQYSLACAIVEFLTGHPPFPLPDRLAVMEAQLRRTPPDVSGRRPWIPHAVDSILAKCLAKEPGARYNSCSEPVRLITRALRDIEPPAPRSRWRR